MMISVTYAISADNITFYCMDDQVADLCHQIELASQLQCDL